MWVKVADALGKAKEMIVLWESSQHVSCVVNTVMVLGLLCQSKETPGLVI